MDDKIGKMSNKDIIRLAVEYLDQDPDESVSGAPCPYQVGDIYLVGKTDCEKYYHQSHPRKHLYEVPILDVVDTDNGIRFWVSQGQLKGLLANKKNFIQV